MPFFGVNISLKFDSPVISVEHAFPGEVISALSTQTNMTNDNTRYYFKAGQITAEGFQFTIRSKKKILTEIYGVDGRSN